MKYRPTIQYSMIQGIFWGCFALVFAFSSVYLLAKGFTNTQVGYVMAAGSALSALLQPALGGFVDRSKKLILHSVLIALSMIMIVLAGLLLSLGKTFWLIALLYGLLVTFQQMITPITYSLSMFFLSRGVHINFGIARGIGSISYAVVAAVLGVLVEKWNEDLVIACVIIFYAVFLVVVATFHFHGVKEEKLPQEVQEKKHGGILAFVRENPAFSVVLLGNVFVFISHNILNNYLFQIVEYHGYGSKEMGYAAAVAAVFELPTLFLLSRINSKISSANLFRLSMVFFFLKNLCLYLATGMPMIYFAMSLHILGYGLFAGISVIYVNESIAVQDQTRGQALMTMTVTLGAVIGSLLGGSLIDRIQVPGMLLVSGVIALIGTIIVSIFARKTGGH